MQRFLLVSSFASIFCKGSPALARLQYAVYRMLTQQLVQRRLALLLALVEALQLCEDNENCFILQFVGRLFQKCVLRNVLPFPGLLGASAPFRPMLPFVKFTCARPLLIINKLNSRCRRWTQLASTCALNRPLRALQGSCPAQVNFTRPRSVAIRLLYIMSEGRKNRLMLFYAKSGAPAPPFAIIKATLSLILHYLFLVNAQG